MRANQQQGFTIVAAIFILVVLSTLAMYLVNISGSVHSAASMTQLSTKAYYAARSGLEWGVHNALHPTGAGCAASTTFPISAGGINFTTTVNCTSTTANEANDTATLADDTYSIYTIRSTSRFGISTDFDYASRTLTMSATNAP